MALDPRDHRDRLIVALDVPGLAEAERLLDRLAGVVSTFKVGALLFTAAGPAAVDLVRKRGGRVFLDLKYHDIPVQVFGAVREAARLGVSLLTVHASGGRAMLRAAVEAAADGAGERPRLLAVTVLTSLDRGVLQRELKVPMAGAGDGVHPARAAPGGGRERAVASPPGGGAPPGHPGAPVFVVAPGRPPP